MKKASLKENELTGIEKYVRSRVQHYNPKKYWKRYKIVTNRENKTPKILKYWYLLYLKKCDAFNNATMGAQMGRGITFEEIPKFPHGLYGIILSREVKLGKNVTIFHQVTLGTGKGGAPTIGSNVTIGAGAKVLGKIKIGDNVLIGSGAVVTFDVPDNSIVRAAKGTIFQKEN